jgi:transposase
VECAKKPYSMDLRERVLAACDAGSGTKAAADRFAVSESWVRRLKQQRRNGQTAPRPPRNHRAPKLAPHADAIRKRVAAVKAIETAGCTVRYLPPYSPDYNPIELAFSKLKGLLRSAGKRTIDGLWDFLGKSLDAFPPDECRAYFRHDGYATPPPLLGT